MNLHLHSILARLIFFSGQIRLNPFQFQVRTLQNVKGKKKNQKGVEYFWLYISIQPPFEFFHILWNCIGKAA